MKTVVISLEELTALASGRAIICGPVEVRVAQDDLDGLMVALAVHDVVPIMGRLRDLEHLDD